MIYALVAYVCIVVFVAAVIVRGRRAASMPIHLRWEIYPVAHEKGKAHYGGSYFEELDWWTKPRPKSRVSELTAMGAEILLLKGVWEHNRSLWYRSYPFHLGIYMLMAFVPLLILNAFLEAVGVTFDGTGFVGFLERLAAFLGFLGMLLTAFGSFLMLLWRLTNEDVRDYTKLSHLFNLVIFLVVMVLFVIAVSVVPQPFDAIRGFVRGLITFHPVALESSAMAAALVLGLLLLAYIPLTHMAHFFLKYFTWHAIRWNDEPNLPGGPMEAKIGAMLNQPVSWAAEHIGADGKKTWAELATTDMPEEKKDEAT